MLRQQSQTQQWVWEKDLDTSQSETEVWKRSAVSRHTVSEWPVEKALTPLFIILGGKWVTKPVVCPGSRHKSGLAYLPPRLLMRTRHSSGKNTNFRGPETRIKWVLPDWIISHDQTFTKVSDAMKSLWSWGMKHWFTQKLGWNKQFIKHLQ